MEILDSKKVSNSILEEAKIEIASLKDEDLSPTLAVVRIGNDVGTVSYEKSILNLLKDFDIKSITFDKDTPEEEFLQQLEKLNNDEQIDGILLLKPFPKDYDENLINEFINPSKDVDAIHPNNLGKLLINDKDGFIPCTPLGILELLKSNDISLKGKNVVVINNSNLLGKPLAMLLTNEFATVDLCHEFTKDLSQYTKEADIIITAAGVPGLIKPEMINDDCILIDVAVATQRDKDKNPIYTKTGKVKRCGDVSEQAANKAKMVTTLTNNLGGGTGSITTALLAKNLIKAARKISNGNNRK